MIAFNHLETVLVLSTPSAIPTTKHLKFLIKTQNAYPLWPFYNNTIT